MTSRNLIICLLASMVMRNPLLLKMRHISFLMFSVSLGVAQPRSQGLSSSHKREWSKKDPGSGWSRALVTKLSSWEGYQFFRKLSPLAFVTSKTRFEQSPCFLVVFIVRFRVAATGMLI